MSKVTGNTKKGKSGGQRRVDSRVAHWGLATFSFSEDLTRVGALMKTDPDMALAKCRQILESRLHMLHAERVGPAGTKRLEQLISDLSRAGALPRKVIALCEVVRELGNVGVHPILDDEKLGHSEAHIALQSLTIILEWYVRSKGPDNA
jgi:hypothetical protein